MNIAQLIHRQPSLTINLPHFPTYTIDKQHKNWYFYSSENKTLKKKPINTNIIDFLYKDKTQESQDYYLYILKQNDHKKDKLEGIAKVQVTQIDKGSIKGIRQKIKEDQILRINQWKTEDYQKNTIIRVDKKFHAKLWNIYYSENIVTCQAPITQHLKGLLTAYCLDIKGIIESKVLRECQKVREFEIVFLWESETGKIKLLFLQNIRLKQENLINPLRKQIYWTNFKIGADQYERIEIQIKDDIQQSSYELKYEEKRIKYLNFLRKMAAQNNKNTVTGLDKETTELIIKQFACSACRNHVALKEGQSQRLVTANRIPEIQLRRQVKMQAKSSPYNYDSVPICQLCFKQFVAVYEDSQVKNWKQKINSDKAKLKENEESINISLKQYKNSDKLKTTKQQSIGSQKFFTNQNAIDFLKLNKNKIEGKDIRSSSQKISRIKQRQRGQYSVMQRKSYQEKKQKKDNSFYETTCVPASQIQENQRMIDILNEIKGYEVETRPQKRKVYRPHKNRLAF